MVPAENSNVPAAVSDATRGDFLKLSRALSVFLLIVYVCVLAECKHNAHLFLLQSYVGSRFYLHNPPGDNDSLHELSDAPASFKADLAKFEEEEPELNPWFCIIILIVTVVLTGVTAEFVRRPRSQPTFYFIDS